MRCPRCQTENRTDRKFCAACGAALERVCAECGFKNAPSNRFYDGCGRPLAAASRQFATVTTRVLDFGATPRNRGGRQLAKAARSASRAKRAKSSKSRRSGLQGAIISLIAHAGISPELVGVVRHGLSCAPRARPVSKAARI